MFHEKSGGCSSHIIEEDLLKEIVLVTVRKHANTFLEAEHLIGIAKEYEVDDLQELSIYGKEMQHLKSEQDRYYNLCAGLHEDMCKDVVTKEEFDRLRSNFEKKIAELEKAKNRQETMARETLKKGILSARQLKAFQDCMELMEIDRHTLSSLLAA